MQSKLTFTLLQSDLHWEDKQANRKMFERKIASITGPKEVVVLPEMFTTGFSMRAGIWAETMEGDTLQWMREMAARFKIILTGSIIVEEEGNYYNRLVWMQPNGQFGVYDKRHLFTLSGEDAEFSAGDKKLIAQVKGWKISTQICYDLRFPVWCRQTKDNPYDVLLFVANWPEKRIQAWKTLLQARAIENQCYVVAVNRVGEDGNGLRYTGESCIVDPLGEARFCNSDEDTAFTLTLDKQLITDTRERFQFLHDADQYVIV